MEYLLSSPWGIWGRKTNLARRRYSGFFGTPVFGSRVTIQNVRSGGRHSGAQIIFTGGRNFEYTTWDWMWNVADQWWRYDAIIVYYCALYVTTPQHVLRIV